MAKKEIKIHTINTMYDSMKDSIDLPKEEFISIVDNVFTSIKENAMNGLKTRIDKFGTFELSEKKQKIGIHPINGTEITIRSDKTIKLKGVKL